MGLCLRRLGLQYHRVGWQGSTGISGNFRPEYARLWKHGTRGDAHQIEAGNQLLAESD